MSNNKDKKVLIASICPEQVYSHYVSSLSKALLYFASCKNSCPITYEIAHATYLHDGRNIIVNRAKDIGATHIIWIDADMVFPHHAFETLLNHNLDYVGVNYATRQPPHFFTAMVRILKGENEENMDIQDILGYTPVYTTDNSFGLERVDSIGFGLCLTAVHLFDKIEKPWFEYQYIPAKDSHAGEDVYLSKKLESIVPLYVDHDLSKQVKHISVGFIDHNAPNRKMVKEVTGASQILDLCKPE